MRSGRYTAYATPYPLENSEDIGPAAKNGANIRVLIWTEVPSVEVLTFLSGGDFATFFPQDVSGLVLVDYTPYDARTALRH